MLKIKRMFAIFLTISLFLTSIQTQALFVFAADASHTVDAATAANRTNALVKALNGKYFTTTQKSCGNSSCPACYNANIIKQSWLKNATGLVPNSASLMPEHYQTSTGFVTSNAWSCAGFANYCLWYIYAKNPSDNVRRTLIYSGTFTKNNIGKSGVRTGDVIRIKNDKGYYHSVVYISHNSSGMTVLDSNWDSSRHNLVQKHTISWSWSSGNPMAITRGKNWSSGHTHKYTGARVYQPEHPHAISQRCVDYDSCKGFIWTGEYYTDPNCSKCHTHKYTGARLHQPEHPHAISQRCVDYDSCKGFIWTGEYYTDPECPECWNTKLTNSTNALTIKKGQSATATVTISGVYPSGSLVYWDYDKSIVSVENKNKAFVFTGLKKGSCNFTLSVYSKDKSASDAVLLARTSIKITITVDTYSIRYDLNGGSSDSDLFNLEWSKEKDADFPLLISTPKKTGYTFLGWNENKNATSATYPKAGTFKGNYSTVFYAIYEPNTYTVKYDANGGSGSMSRSSHTYDTAKALNANGFTRSGYSFLGWSTSKNATSATYTDKQSVKNLTSSNGVTITLYAVWKKLNTYTVSYDANGGINAPSVQTKMQDLSLTLTNNIPARTGYQFQHWQDTTDGASYTRGSVYQKNRDATLRAVWEANTYTVKYDANGGSGSMSSSSHTYDTAKALNANGFSRSGYSFLGWSTNKTATSATYTDKQSVKNLTSSNGETIMLYAVWKKLNTYTVSYDANGGIDAPFAQTKMQDQSLTLTNNIPARTGYQFQHWQDTTDGASYTRGSVYQKNRDATLRAVWEANTYTVKYDANGGSGLMSSSLHTYDTAKELTANQLSRFGYTFLGWSTNKNATEPDYTDQQSIKNLTAVNGETVILYAIWQEAANYYTISYDANGGSDAPIAQKKKHGQDLKLSDQIPTFSGRTFDGWAETKAVTATYLPGDTYTKDMSVTLYAMWHSNTIYIEFDANGGSGTMSTITYKAREKKPLKKNQFTRNGYTFIGWSTDKNATSPTYANIQSVSFPCDKDQETIRLYAVWKKVENITTNPFNDTTIVPPTTSKIANPPAPPEELTTTIPSTEPDEPEESTEPPEPSEPVYVLGDVNGDNRITSADARLALRAAVNLETLTDLQRLAADVDQDGNVRSADARMILRVAVGLVSFDGEE